jgi:hypothetical protein
MFFNLMIRNSQLFSVKILIKIIQKFKIKIHLTTIFKKKEDYFKQISQAKKICIKTKISQK